MAPARHVFIPGIVTVPRTARRAGRSAAMLGAPGGEGDRGGSAAGGPETTTAEQREERDDRKRTHRQKEKRQRNQIEDNKTD